MGYSLDDEELNKAFTRFKELADRKKVITDADLEALIADEFYRPNDVFQLEGLQVSCGTLGMPTATVRLRGPDQQIHNHASLGTGPVDATYKAIDAIVKTSCKLLEFNVHAVTEGIDALGEVTVRIMSENAQQTMDAQSEALYSRVFGGHGADTDIIVASAKAYINALNKLIVAMSENAPAQSETSVAAG
jgi:2-isopropylmalate synthase